MKPEAPSAPITTFFETSFSRTYSRDIILVEVSGDGVTGWGEVTAGENPFYNEEWTDSAWGILHDYVAPRVLGKTLNSAEDVFPLTAPTFAGTIWRAAVWRPRSGIWKRACTACRCGSRSARARGRDSVRRLDRHSGFGGAVVRKDRNRAGRRLSAHQDEDQAGLGCGRGAPRARALSRDQADGRRQLRLHPGRHRPPEASSTIST